MSDVSNASGRHAPVAAGSAHGEQLDRTTQTQAHGTQSRVGTYPEVPGDWKSGLSFRDRKDDRKNDFTEEERRHAWAAVDEAVKAYSDEMVQRWIVEMDTLLVYAGLFSAVLTAFNVESYSLLSPTAPDPVLAALTQISAQLGSFSVHDPFVNSTQPAFQTSSVPSDSTSPQRWAVWLNALWFSSLICSLSAASVAIMVKQWIHEYNSGISGTSRHTAHLRQHRYNGLIQWKVAAIVAVLPILLQIALGLFLAGLLVLVWNLNRTVAIVASALVGALLAFTLVTIILPAFTSNCAYLSPLSLSVFRLCRLVFMHVPWSLLRGKLLSVYRNAPDGSIRERIGRWLWRTCPKSLSPTVYAMQSAHVTEKPLELDQDVFVSAYSTTGDLSLLEHASTCFAGHSIDKLGEFLHRIDAQNLNHGQSGGSQAHWTQFIPLDMASDMLLVDTNKSRGAGQETSPDMAGRYLSWSHVVPGDHRFSCVLSNMAAVLFNYGNRLPDNFPMSDCLSALSRQINSVKETNGVLTDVIRRHVIAAIYTVLHTRYASLLPGVGPRLRECGLCLGVLISCSPPSTESGSHPGETAEEDAIWKPLADAIAMAEDEVIRTLQRPEFLHQSSWDKCCDMECFFDRYQDIGLAQLASRVSEKMLRALVRALQDLHPESYYEKYWARSLLRWLQSLEKERDTQILMRAAAEGETARPSSNVVETSQGPRT